MLLAAGIASARARLERAGFDAELALRCVLAAAVLLLFAGLGNHDFWRPDEPRYGSIAEELRSFVHGWRGLILLHANGAAYTQKPPLFFWLGALFGAPFGRTTEYAARLPSALAGFGTLLAVAWLGRSMFGRRAGVLAAALLLTLPAWLQLARSARLDAMLAAFVVLAFVYAWRIDRGIGDERRNRVWLHVSIGLGMLTKGPVALLLPLLGVLAYLGWERRLASWRRFVTLPSLALSVAPVAIWFGGATLLAPKGFAHTGFWENLVLRFFSGVAHEEPFWFYFDRLPRGFLPWTLLLPGVWFLYREARTAPDAAERVRPWRFLLAAVAASVLFFSASAGKRGVYLLPVYPLLALLAAAPLAAWLDRDAPAPRWLQSALLAAGVALAALGIAAVFVHEVRGFPLPPAFGFMVAAGPLAALLAQPWLRARVAPRTALVAGVLVALIGAEAAVFLGLYPALDERNSPREVAELAAASAKDAAPIGVFRSTSLSGAIAYYSRHPVKDLREAKHLEAFRAEGGSVIVVDERDVEKLRELVPVREIGHGHSRQRRLWVVAPDA